MEYLLPVIAAAFLLAIVGWLILGDRLEPDEPRNAVEDAADRLGGMFEELEDLGYDTESPLDWNYVFMHREYAPLARLTVHLKGEGYEHVLTDEIREPENEFVEHKAVFRKREKHTEHTLAARNIEFRQLASTYGVDLYDGSWVIDPNEDDGDEQPVYDA